MLINVSAKAGCCGWLLCVSTSLSSIHRVFISNLQKEIEKQTRHRPSRKRRSESQYDYEVYHSLEEVDVKLAIYPPICPSPLPSNLMHTQSKQTSSPQSCHTQNYLIPQPSLRLLHTLRHMHSTTNTSQLYTVYFPTSIRLLVPESLRP